MSAATAATLAPVDRLGIRSRLAREANATFAIAWREILRAIKSPLSIAFTVIFPVIFIGILGGSISQNLSGALPYAYLPFMLIGMIANTMYQGTITGVTNPIMKMNENGIGSGAMVSRRRNRNGLWPMVSRIVLVESQATTSAIRNTKPSITIIRAASLATDSRMRWAISPGEISAGSICSITIIPLRTCGFRSMPSCFAR